MFYAYATLYGIKKNKRVNLAIKAVQQQDTLVAIITYLLAFARFQQLITAVNGYKESKRIVEFTQ